MNTINDALATLVGYLGTGIGEAAGFLARTIGRLLGL